MSHYRKIPRFVAPMTFAEAFRALSGGASPNESIPRFCRAFADYIGVKHAVIAPSGRYALVGILHGFEFKTGGEIIMPALTFHSVPAVIADFGLRPAFVDIDPSTYCIDVDKIEAAVNENTVAILPTHLYGQACNMEAIRAIAKKHNLKVIEDCAQACGGAIGDKKLGSFGDAAFYSFGPTKNLAALWAGMIVTDSDEIANRARQFLQTMTRIGKGALIRRMAVALAMRGVTLAWFWQIFMSPALGILARFSIDPIEKLTSESPSGKAEKGGAAGLMPRQIQGRIATSQLMKLDQSNARRARNGRLLIEKLRGVPGIELPAARQGLESIFMSFPVRVKNPEAFGKGLLGLGVDTTTGYMSVCPQLPGLDDSRIDAPVSEEAVDKMVHLPVYPELGVNEIQRIAVAVKKVLGDY